MNSHQAERSNVKNTEYFSRQVMACREMTKSITCGAGECCKMMNKKKPDPGQKRFGKLEFWNRMKNVS